MSAQTLVIHTGGLGDFLLACPAISHLAESGPVELAGYAERLRLGVLGGIAEAAYDLDAISFDTVFHEPAPRLRAFLSRFTEAVVWMRHAEVIVDVFRSCGIHGARAIPGLPPEGWIDHASTYYLNQLGLPPSPPFRIPVTALLPYAPSGPSPDVLIHPGSGGKRKNWPMERFAALADLLAMMGKTVHWCVGPAEEELRLPDSVNTVQPESPAHLAGLLRASCLYVGNDSGATHLAAATGVPVIAIFGPTDPDVWRPLGDNVHILGGHGAFPSIEEVFKTATDTVL